MSKTIIPNLATALLALVLSISACTDALTPSQCSPSIREAKMNCGNDGFTFICAVSDAEGIMSCRLIVTSSTGAEADYSMTWDDGTSSYVVMIPENSLPMEFDFRFSISNGKDEISSETRHFGANVIRFMDQKVQDYCLNWDTDNDGMLTREEAASVVVMDRAFPIGGEHFPEYEYFTGLDSELGTNGIFAGNQSIKDVVLPGTMSFIEGGAFRNCTALETITLNRNIDVYDRAFMNTPSLREIAGKASGISGDHRFYHFADQMEIFASAGLEEYVIPEGITSVFSGMFANTTTLKKVTFPTTFNQWGVELFANSSIETVIFNEGIDTLPMGEFEGCGHLKEVRLASTMVYIVLNNFLTTNVPLDIYLPRSTPPTIDLSTYAVIIPSTLKIHIPKGSLASYTSSTAPTHDLTTLYPGLFVEDLEQ